MSTDIPHHLAAEARVRRIGLLSTYPPKLCGLATFAFALEQALVRAGEHVEVVAIDDGRSSRDVSTNEHSTGGSWHPSRWTLQNGSAVSVQEIAGVLSRSDLAIIQHEYGIYGGADGDEVVDLVEALTVPAIVILHTVPSEPTPHQRYVLERVCDVATRFVVMTEAAGRRLVDSYSVDATKLVTIPHGASPPVPAKVSASSGTGSLSGRRAIPSVGPRMRQPPQLLTWGLLGPGKGIEHVIDAMALLTDLRPRVRYTVSGVTHPNVLAREGDRYRESLIRRAWANGVAGSVTFDDSYRDVPTLMRFVATSSVVVLPYDSRDQATSGVLVDAIAAGRPVIATAFPHATEMLSTGAGIVVPHGDPAALAAAIRAAMTDQSFLASMAAEARAIAPSLTWDAVAAQYQRLSDGLALVTAEVAG